MEIPEIGINSGEIDIMEVNIPVMPSWLTSDPPRAIQFQPPVTTQIGIPIVDMPGCVEAHEKSDDNDKLVGDDPKGARVFCDAGMPSYNTMDYNKGKLKFTREAQVPPIAPTDTPEVDTPEVPDTSKAVTAKVECPTESQRLKEPVGHIKGDKKVIEYRLVGKECIQVIDDLNIPDQIIGNIPSAGAVTATASIAVVATTSALLAKPLADLLLKVVKPTVKKVVKKVAALRGKTPAAQSLVQRRQEQRQRNQAIRTLKGR